MLDPFTRRRAGILLHPTSLPGPWGSGDMGPEARNFIDFLAACGQTIWQMLPLGPTHHHRSPYQCLSVHAGDPQLISPDDLIARGWLSEEDAQCGDDEPHAPFDYRLRLLEQAFQGFIRRGDAAGHERLAQFRAEHHDWLPDFALYQALRKEHQGRDWSQWPAPLRDREAAALEEARRRLHGFIEQTCFEQFVFFTQWQALKAYANERGILMFGDLPIFVAYDSADVWAERQYFELDDAGRPRVVAGVPPDYFSETGQRWGNPHYRWEAMAGDGFQWWKRRIAMQLRLFDMIRIDHFRGFQAYWEIPAEEETAMNGRWVEAPGEALFEALRDHYGVLPFVAEDLGIITPEVTTLRERFHLPGMRILQFAFDGNRDNPYLPHNHEHNAVVYTGTHDNDTTLGWYESVDDATRRLVNDYVGSTEEAMPWPMVRLALASVARTAVIPMQDVLGLGGGHRMNTPGTTEENWLWRFQWAQLPEGAAERLRHLTQLYGR